MISDYVFPNKCDKEYQQTLHYDGPQVVDLSTFLFIVKSVNIIRYTYLRYESPAIRVRISSL